MPPRPVGGPCHAGSRALGVEVPRARPRRFLAKSGDADKGQVQVNAKNNAKKGQTAFGQGTAAALAGHTLATVQVLTDDATCFEATMTNVSKADGASFVAKLP